MAAEKWSRFATATGHDAEPKTIEQRGGGAIASTDAFVGGTRAGSVAYVIGGQT